MTINRREKKTYLSYFRGSHEKYVPLHYLWGLLFCNLKIEQTKHLATISSAKSACVLCFHYPSPLAESLTHFVWEGPVELV